MQDLGQAGVIRPSRDEAVRSAFLLNNDLAMLLLRPHLSQVVGIDPLSRDGLVRWSAEVADVYMGGVFLPGPAGAQAEGTHREGDHGGAGR